MSSETKSWSSGFKLKFKLKITLLSGAAALGAFWLGLSEARANTETETWGRGGFAVGPSYYFLKDQPYAGLLRSSGFDVPEKNRPAFDLQFFKIFGDEWRMGFDVAWLGMREAPGASDATYYQIKLSVLFSKDLIADPMFDLNIGGQFGIGSAEVEILSPTANGRVVEDSFLVEPTLSVACRISRSAKVGLTGMYSFPLELGSETKGQDLGLGQISAQGFALGVQIMLGSFGGPI